MTRLSLRRAFQIDRIPARTWKDSVDPPVETFRLLTEDGDPLLTEDGDHLVSESSNG